METETAAPAETGGEAVGVGLDLQAMLDGVAPEQTEKASPAEATPTPEGEEPETSVSEEAKVEETVEAKPEEGKPAEQTAEEFSEPLPGKLGKLLETLGKDQKTADLARQLRADHEALNGPEGFRGMFRTVEEAREYKTVAPTVDDLNVMADYSQRYDRIDREYVNDPVGLIRTLAEDGQAFGRVAESFEPALRQINNPQLYEVAAKPFNQNFWRNVVSTVEREGTPEEIELFKAFEQKYLGGLSQGQFQPASRFQGTPEWQELQQLRAERAASQGQTHQSFFQDVNRDLTPGLRTEVRKYLDEKAGAGLPEGVRGEILDEMAENVSNQIFKEINGNPIVASELNRMIESGDFSPNHKAQVIERVMTRAKAYLPTKSAPEIKRISDRMRKLTGGNGNITKPTTTTAKSKDVGSGSPTVGGVKTGSMPRGAPQGFNLMGQDEKLKLINLRKTGGGDPDEGEVIFLEACMTGDWSKVVLKGS